MRRGSRKADEIQRRTTTDHKDVAVPVQRRVIDRLPALLDECKVIFTGLPAGQDDRLTSHVQNLGMSTGVVANGRKQTGIGRHDMVIGKDQHTRHLVRLVEQEQIANGRVLRRKDPAGKKDAVRVFEPDFFL